MKKRIVCVLLTLIMLLSLVPMGASAASHTTSEAAITVLKQMTSFSANCYHFTGSEFRTGYGTVCEERHHFKTDGTPDDEKMNEDGTFANVHTITEKNADLALRKALLALDEKVCSFASANGLSLAQHQHDALVVFSYDAGTDWMTGNGVLKSVIINNGSSTELLNAMNLWTNYTNLSRRKVEVNMYMNGVYTNAVPTSYGYVKYNPNGGTIAQRDYNAVTAANNAIAASVAEENGISTAAAGNNSRGILEDIIGGIIDWITGGGSGNGGSGSGNGSGSGSGSGNGSGTGSGSGNTGSGTGTGSGSTIAPVVGEAVYTFLYDLNTTMAHPAVPTKNGATFLGWYANAETAPGWAPVLNGIYNTHTLTALWQTNAPVAVSYQLKKSQLAELNVYDEIGGDSDDIVTTQTTALAEELKWNSDLVWVDYDYIDGNGNRWSHLAKVGGWVKVGTHSGSTNPNVYVDVIVTVTNNRLNRRVNASIASATNGSYSKGDQLRIINTDYADGFLWGQVAASGSDDTPVGWVALMYTNWNDVKDSGNSGASTNNGSVIGTATVTVNGYLNLRDEPGTDGKIIGALAKNDTVDLYEIKTVNGQQWGRSKHGWLCLTYTRVILKENVTISDAGAMIYAFTGEYKGTNALKVHVEPGTNTNYVTYYVYPMVSSSEEPVKTDLSIPSGTDVTLTNLFMVENELWAKATWSNKEEKWTKVDDKMVYDFEYVTRSGWVKFSNIDMDPATFTVAADSVNVRDNWGDAANLIFSLNKGVQIKVDAINLVGENLWGHFTVKMQEHTGEVSKSGYVNLASKYFTRDGAPSIEDNATTSTGLIATVINTDSLKVRSTGASYGTLIDTLSRGTTVAVWESNDDGWYKVDSNQNGTYDYEGDGWCSGAYLDVRNGSVSSSTVTDAAGNKYETDGTGKGIVANTYSGVNVRTGPGTGYAPNGKLLPGTVVEILETANGGKWGRVAQGWISMDYVTMITYNEVVNNTANGGTTVESYDKADKTTTTAVYTGTLSAGTVVYRTPEEKASEALRTTTVNENVTMYELATVTKVVESDEYQVDDKTTTTTITSTTYWARINDGWVKNPENCLTLDALDEKVHTQTGVSKLNVRKGTDTQANDAGDVFDVLVQGDQVNVTALDIIKDKVWGRIDTAEGTGWIRLDYMSEGAIYVQAPVQNNTVTAPSAPVLGNTSSTGGYVNNSTGYRYTGKVIRANEVNVRANPSTTAAKTTSLKNGAALVVYETTVAENMAWGRCDAGWIYLYYVDLTPVVNGAVDARVVYNENTIIYTDVNCSAVAGTYSRMSTIDIYEIVGKMARTELGWVNTDNLL